jgi:hypothetical protein
MTAELIRLADFRPLPTLDARDLLRSTLCPHQQNVPIEDRPRVLVAPCCGELRYLAWNAPVAKFHTAYELASNRWPYRFQRSSRAGWRKPEGGYCIGRSGPFAIPWRTVRPGPDGGIPRTSAEIVDLYRDWLKTQPKLRRLARERLADRPLGCYCDYWKPCHADVLLEVANHAP